MDRTETYVLIFVDPSGRQDMEPQLYGEKRQGGSV